MTAKRPGAIDTLIVALFAAAAHFTLFALDRNPLDADSPRYVTLAHSLLGAHRFYAPDLIAHAAPPGLFPIGPPVPETLRTPGYPLFLAVIFVLGGGLRTAVFIQHLIAVALAAAVQRFAARRVDRTAGIVAGLLVSVSPALLFFSNKIMSDVLMLAFLSAALAMLLRQRPGIGGIAMGIAILIRPIGLYFPIVLLLVKRTKMAIVSQRFHSSCPLRGPRETFATRAWRQSARSTARICCCTGPRAHSFSRRSRQARGGSRCSSRRVFSIARCACVRL